MFIICSETDAVVREPPQVHSLQRLLQPIKIHLLLSLSMENSLNCTGAPTRCGEGAAATDEDPISA